MHRWKNLHHCYYDLRIVNFFTFLCEYTCNLVTQKKYDTKVKCLNYTAKGKIVRIYYCTATFSQ